MMSGLLPLHQFERRLAALGWVLRVLLSKTFTGDAKWSTPAKTEVLSTHFERLSLAQRIYPAP